MIQPGLHIVLVEPEIHWNTGNAGRTSLAAGAKLHLVKPLGFSLDEKQVRRAGLDYWKRVEPVVWENFGAFEGALPSLGTPVFLSPEGERTLWQVDLRGPTVLLFGKESLGFSEAVRAKYRGHMARLPIVDPLVRSLNVSSSVGIATYEALRQRGIT